MSSKRDLSEPDPEVLDENAPKRARAAPALSKVKTKSDFEELSLKCGPYNIDDGSTGNLPTPNVLNDSDLKAVLEAMVPGMSQCAHAVKVDNEASRYPFIYEMLKILVRLVDNLDITTTKKNIRELNEEETAEMADHFERLSEASLGADALQSESAKELIMRWERYFSETGGHKGAGFGYVEFALETKELMVRFLLECKYFLNVTNLPSTAQGFWQACGEIVTAQQFNMKLAGAEASKTAKKNLLAKKTDKPLPPRGTSRSEMRKTDKAHIASMEQIDLDASVESDRAARIAAAEEKKRPLRVALTDFNKWIFIQLEGSDITFSETFTMFELSGTSLGCKDGLARCMQHLCAAIGISSVSGSSTSSTASTRSTIQERLRMITERTKTDVAAAVRQATMSDETRAAIKKSVRLILRLSGLSRESQEFEFEKEFPGLNMRDFE